jgi:hypothetical protein
VPSLQGSQINAITSPEMSGRRHSSSRSIGFPQRSQEKQRQSKQPSPRRRSGSLPCAIDEQVCPFAFMHVAIFSQVQVVGASWHKGALARAEGFLSLAVTRVLYLVERKEHFPYLIGF